MILLQGIIFCEFLGIFNHHCFQLVKIKFHSFALTFWCGRWCNRDRPFRGHLNLNELLDLAKLIPNPETLQICRMNGNPPFSSRDWWKYKAPKSIWISEHLHLFQLLVVVMKSIFFCLLNDSLILIIALSLDSPSSAAWFRFRMWSVLPLHVHPVCGGIAGITCMAWPRVDDCISSETKWWSGGDNLMFVDGARELTRVHDITFKHLSQLPCLASNWRRQQFGHKNKSSLRIFHTNRLCSVCSVHIYRTVAVAVVSHNFSKEKICLT